MLPDRPKAGEKFLCAFRVAKAAHATLSFACRLVAVLDAIVAPGCSFDEQVLHVCQFRDLSFGCGLTAQLVSDDLARHRVRVQHTFEEALGGSLIAPLLHQYGHCQLEEKLQNFSIKSGKTAGNLIDSEVARRSLTAILLTT
jgi:hypothetical protein